MVAAAAGWEGGSDGMLSFSLLYHVAWMQLYTSTIYPSLSVPARPLLFLYGDL